MAARSDSVCKFICEAGDWQVTNLQLQKVLYLSQMMYFGEENDRLTDAAFEAWDYGPVSPRVYRQVKRFGARPIQNVFFDALPFSQTSRRRKLLTGACRDLLALTPGQLVEITHWDNGAWAKHYEPGARGIRIPDADIIDEYAARVRAGHVTPD